MYAKQTESGIKVFGKLPSKYNSETINIIGGFHKLSDEIHRQEGFYPYYPASPFNSDTHKVGPIVWDEPNTMFVQTVVEKTELEIALESWHHPSYVKRIIAPASLLDTYPNIGVWMQINNLPIEIIEQEDGVKVVLYMNIIRPEHQALADSLVGVVTIEDIPTE